MGLFKSKSEKEFEKKMAIKKTINEMNKQIEKLTAAERNFIDLAKKAKTENIPNQYKLALSGLRSTITQKKRVQEMLLNFQIMNQTKDILSTTSEFLKGMGSLSKDMAKLCDEKQFNAVSKDFEKAMIATTAQEERMEMFLDNSRDSFETLSKEGTSAASGEGDAEIEAIIAAELGLSDNAGKSNSLSDELAEFENSLNGSEGKK